jgi:hypothetical protein
VICLARDPLISRDVKHRGATLAGGAPCTIEEVAAAVGSDVKVAPAPEPVSIVCASVLPPGALLLYLLRVRGDRSLRTQMKGPPVLHAWCSTQHRCLPNLVCRQLMSPSAGTATCAAAALKLDNALLANKYPGTPRHTEPPEHRPSSKALLSRQGKGEPASDGDSEYEGRTARDARLRESNVR